MFFNHHFTIFPQSVEMEMISFYLLASFRDLVCKVSPLSWTYETDSSHALLGQQRGLEVTCPGLQSWCTTACDSSLVCAPVKRDLLLWTWPIASISSQILPPTASTTLQLQFFGNVSTAIIAH